ncbi:hypothetical protein PQG76_06525 [Corynebacterium falsenii]|uniref:hypothetical protein n=1 Tax=Corynebacterium falsenii TaxID=108486 RepID=UPI00234D736D|nr:hypothetical protein [Corynebacterium falsenii]MDC7104156.1 hypothetical protein [Corynebacterium falsenii]
MEMDTSASMELFTARQLTGRGVTRRVRRRDFHPVMRGFYVRHGHSLADPVPECPGQGAVTRAVVLSRMATGGVASHFSALALAGMPFFVDDQPTTFRRQGRAVHGTLTPLPARDSGRTRGAGSAGRTRNAGRTRYVSSATTPRPADQVFLIGCTRPPQPHHIWRPLPGRTSVLAQRPMVALADVVASLENGRPHVSTQRWRIPPPLQSRATTVRQVQVIDAFFHAIPPQLTAAQRSLSLVTDLCDAKLLQRLIDLSDPGAESPMETLMRLMVKRPMVERGFRYVSQVDVVVDGRRITRADAIILPNHQSHRIVEVRPRRENEPYPHRVLRLDSSRARGGKGEWAREREWEGAGEWGRERARERDLSAVALMFDGAHHLQRSQRDRDSAILAAVTGAGLPMLRVTAGMLEEPGHLLGLTLQQLRLC